MRKKFEVASEYFCSEWSLLIVVRDRQQLRLEMINRRRQLLEDIQEKEAEHQMKERRLKLKKI